MKMTFAVQTLIVQTFLFVFSCALAAVYSVANCCAADVSVPIKVSEPYGETFRSLEMPENTPAASSLQSLTPLQDAGGRRRDRNLSEWRNDVRPNSSGSGYEKSKEERGGESKMPPPVFPSIPADLGAALNSAEAGTVPVFRPDNASLNNSAKFTKPAEERKGFSVDTSFSGTENKTKQPAGFGNTPSIAATLQDVFNVPPPLPQGTVDSAVIPKTLLTAETSNTELIGGTNTEKFNTAEAKKEKDIAASNTKVNGTLLVATVLLVMTLVFVVITAADYHHRWVQSLTTLNRRYTIPLPDNGWEPASPGDMGIYAAGADYRDDDLPSGFVYNGRF